MSKVQRVGDLEIVEDLDFQRRMWRVQRIGWAFFALILLAGLIGVFGTGPISRGTAGDRDGPLWIRFHRLGRELKPMDLRIQVGAEMLSGDEFRLWLDRDYLQDVTIQRIQPEPESAELSSDQVVYTFKAAAVPQSTGVVVYLEAQRPGLLSGKLGIENGPSLEFKQFMYP